MPKRSIRFRAAGLLIAAACSQVAEARDAPEENVLARQAGQTELCLGFEQWPLSVSEAAVDARRKQPAGIASQLAALEAAGLVLGERVGASVAAGSPAPGSAMWRYTWTAAATPFLREAGVASRRAITADREVRLCWGKKMLDKVVMWEDAMKRGEPSTAHLTYTYKLKDVAQWVWRADVQTAFPLVKRILEDAGRTHELQVQHLSPRAR